MRRNYISPEFKYTDISGTMNMSEISNFFGSKMLEIEDSIYLDDMSIIYYQNSNGEQINLSSESISEPNIWSSISSKVKYHKLSIEKSQTEYQMNNMTVWNLEFDLKNFLSEYIFSQLKKSRAFEGVKNIMTKNGDVNSSIGTYIINNVLNRYKFSRIDLYISYNDLRGNGMLKWNNKFDKNINNDINLVRKYQLLTNIDESQITLTFTQEKPSKEWSFNYYFNILFEKL